MTYRNAVRALSTLDEAIREDEEAKAEALQRGLDASLPLKPATLAKLCHLGDRMLETSRNVQRMQLDVNLSLL